MVPNVKTEDQILITNIQVAVGHDRMSPEPAVGFTETALARNGEAAVFLPAVRRCLNENNRALTFVVAVQLTVRARERTFLEFLLLFPHDLSGLEILADPGAFIIGVPEEMVSDQNDPAMMVDHVLVGVHLLDPEATVRVQQLDEIA